MKEKLKPCPFCGGDAWEANEANKNYLKYSIFCSKCWVSMGCNDSRDRPEESIKKTKYKWNKRVSKEYQEILTDKDGREVKEGSILVMNEAENPRYDFVENRKGHLEFHKYKEEYEASMVSLRDALTIYRETTSVVS